MEREITSLLLLSLLSSFGGVRADLKEYPENVAATQGDTVMLKCSATKPNPHSRIMWTEFATTWRGNTVSDNRAIVPTHPNFKRYSIVGKAEENEFHLRIENVTAGDAGTYLCQDIMSGVPAVFRRFAELIVFASQQVCSPIIQQGVLLEGDSYTTLCQVNYGSATIAPEMEWSGPDGTYRTNKTTTNSSLSSYMTFTAHRSLEGKTFQSKTYFRSGFQVESDHADNVPDYVDTYSMLAAGIRWPPGNMTISPLLSEYRVGDEITCWADSYPEAFYSWLRMWNGTRFEPAASDGATFVMKQDMVGYNMTLRCHAQNLINGVIRSIDRTISANVIEGPSVSTITTSSTAITEATSSTTLLSITSSPSTGPTTTSTTLHTPSDRPPQHKSVVFHSLSFFGGILLGAVVCLMGLLVYKLLSAAKRRRTPPYVESFKESNMVNVEI